MILPAAAPSRASYASAYDSKRGNIILFGGYDGTNFCNDTWRFIDETTGWVQIGAAGARPPARDGCRAIYDPIRDQIVLFSGRTFPNGSPAYPADTWTYSLSADTGWTQLPTIGTPAGRADYAMAYDAAADRIIVHGGGADPFVWALRLSDDHWTNLQPSGGGPGYLIGHTMTYVPERDEAVVLFGNGAPLGLCLLAETWTLSLGSSPMWLKVFTGGPMDRIRHGAAYDSDNNEVFMCGGSSCTALLGDAWVFPSTSGARNWIITSYPSPLNPSARDGADVLYDSARRRFILQGGYDATSGWLSDTWSFSWDFPVPTQISLVSAEAANGTVVLDWYSEDHSLIGRVYRSGDERTWTPLGTTSADGTGHLRFQDHGVQPGGHYYYRLGVMVGGTESFIGEAIVDVPGAGVFAIGAVRFADGGVSVRLTLPSAGEVDVALLDVSGRLVAGNHAMATAPGQMEIGIDTPHLAPGLYFARVRLSGQTISRKAVLFR